MTNTLYRHYKGGYYIVLGIARLHDSWTDYVVYQETGTPAIWLRLFEDFYDQVQLADGSWVDRFNKVTGLDTDE